MLPSQVATLREVVAPTPRDNQCTILFTDMQSSTALAHQLGDEAAQEVRRAHDEIVRAR